MTPRALPTALLLALHLGAAPAQTAPTAQAPDVLTTDQHTRQAL